MLKFRTIMLTVIVFYFIHSQVTPYIHFHHHNYESSDQLILLAESSHDECTHLQSCKIHIHDHVKLKVDWNVVNNTHNTQLDHIADSIELLSNILIDCTSDKQIFIVQKSFYSLKFILTNFSNKAPPICT